MIFFRDPRPRITLDFETRGSVELKKSGAYKYSLDPETQPTCLAFKTAEMKQAVLLKFEMINRPWKDLPEKFRNAWFGYIVQGYLFCAHNAFFETCIYKNILVKRYGWPDIPFKQFRCTAAKAAACALPRNLEGAGAALNLTTQKDKRGYVAMMATCKPTKAWSAWAKAVKEGETKRLGVRKQNIIARGEPMKFLSYEANPTIWETLYEYCRIDVLTEELLDNTLPDLIPQEQEIWFLNQKLNWRGLKIDIPTVQKIVKIMSQESVTKLKELDALTMGLVTKPGARKSILEFLELEGIILPDIRAKTVEDILKDGKLTEDGKRLLEIRKALSKTSTKKYQSFLERAGADGRVRDILLYHGASTGRDTGTGIQPHNFPRGTIHFDKDCPYEPVENVIECDEEILRLLYGDTLSNLFSSTLRNMIIPSEGSELFVADFSKIEVAVLWWLSGNVAGLEILKSGKDPYIYQAAKNTGKSYKEIEQAVLREEKWALDARQLGKAQILGCGFGMGWRKFQTTAFDQYRLKLTKKQSREAVTNYREANEAVAEMWKKCELAAILAVERGKTYIAGRCKFFYQDRFLWIELPSGRRLAYRDPEINWCVREYEVDEPVLNKDGSPKIGEDGEPETTTVTKYSAPQKTLEFWAVNSKTKQWAKERTWGGTLTENIVQAVARDLMMPAMVRLENAGYRALLMVHDEALCEKSNGHLEEFVEILLKRPVWADRDLPLNAKGWAGPRYRK